jgi:Tol biopolymer transport system component
MLAICLLALVETTNTAEATSVPENGKIAFSSSDGSIYTVEADGSNLKQLTNGPHTDTQPIWSPDGTEILFIRQAEERGKTGIYVMSADGSNQSNLYTSEYLDFEHLTWSPDGTKLAFGSYSEGDIYMMNVDGSNKTNITNTPGLYESNPDFSPDGSQLCFFGFNNFSRPKPATGIYVMDTDGSNLTLLTTADSEGTAEVECDWSPDGTKLAFDAHPFLGAEGRDSRKALKKALAEGDSQKTLEMAEKLRVGFDQEVYVINADGSGKTSLTSNSEDDLTPDWSPDGTKITFARPKEGLGYPSDIYTMDADGSEVAPVTTNSGVTDPSPDWQPLTPKNRSVTVHQPPTGGPSLLLVASALLFSGGVLFYAGLKRRM